MPRVTKKEVLAERQDERQPFLLDAENVPVRADLLEAVRKRSYEHRAARLLEDDKQVLRLVELLMLDAPIRKISREMNVSRHTIRAARKELVRQGKMAPYKERVVNLFEEIVETGARNYRDALEDGLVAPAQIPVGAAIFFDKRAATLGEPTQIVAAQVASQDLTVEKLNGWIESLPEVRVIEEQSIEPGKSTEGKA